VPPPRPSQHDGRVVVFPPRLVPRDEVLGRRAGRDVEHGLQFPGGQRRPEQGLGSILRSSISAEKFSKIFSLSMPDKISSKFLNTVSNCLHLMVALQNADRQGADDMLGLEHDLPDEAGGCARHLEAGDVFKMRQDEHKIHPIWSPCLEIGKTSTFNSFRFSRRPLQEM
jgi:hypothetical protein